MESVVCETEPFGRKAVIYENERIQKIKFKLSYFYLYGIRFKKWALDKS